MSRSVPGGPVGVRGGARVAAGGGGTAATGWRGLVGARDAAAGGQGL